MNNQDKRRFQRHKSSILIHIHTAETTQHLQAMLNIGEGGLAFESELAWDIGAHIRITWPAPLEFSLDFQELHGNVVWCTRRIDENEHIVFEVGVEFARPDSEAVDMTALIEELYQQLEEIELEVLPEPLAASGA